MALDREMFILRTMVHELESLGYAVEERVVDTWRYGVPQFRQRLILVAMRDGVGVPVAGRDAGQGHRVERHRGPARSRRRVAARGRGGGLGGLRQAGDRRSSGGCGEGMDGEDAGKVFDHITRPVREDDERAFQLMDRRRGTPTFPRT